jgi:hypothetical protein
LRGDALLNGIHGLLEHNRVVGVRQQIAMIEHGDPLRTIGDHLGRIGIFNHLTRHHHRKHEAISLHVVLGGFPGQLKANFEALDHPFLLQLVQS